MNDNTTRARGTKRVQCEIPLSWYDTLDRYAGQRNVSVSSVLQKMIQREVSRLAWDVDLRVEVAS